MARRNPSTPRRHSADRAHRRDHGGTVVAPLPGPRRPRPQLDLTSAGAAPPGPVPLRCVARSSGRRSPRSAPINPDTSSSIISAAPAFDRLADHASVLIEQHLPDDLLDRPPVGTGHRWRLLSSNRENSDDHERRGGRNHAQRGSVRPRSYTDPRDVIPPTERS
jgi:hypothetical protein